MTKRAAIYARVSSTAQRDSHTIENQLRTLPTFVSQQGWKLVGTFVDDGRSASTGKLDKRDGFAALLRAAALGKFDVLVVVDVDRLTRTDDMRERAEILGPFQKLGIEIATPGMGLLDLRTMLGELYVMMQAMVASEENKKRAERIKLGKARAIAENRKPAGPTPFGLAYNRATGTWSIDEPAALAIREIAQRVLAGESCPKIAAALAMRDDVKQPRGGWTKEAVYRTVESTYVYGEWIVDKRKGLAISVPVIVPREEWLDVKRALQKRQRSSVGRTKHVYLLQDIAKCGVCEAPMHIRSSVEYYNAAREHREHPAAYVCSARKLRQSCMAKPVVCKVLDARVWLRVSEEIEQPALIQALADAGERRANDETDWRADIDKYAAHLARLDKVETAITQRFRRGLLSESGLDRELEALGRERNMVREQLATAERAAGANQTAQERLRGAASLIERLRLAMPRATVEQRQRLLRELAAEVTIVDGQAVLDLRLVRPEPSVTAQPAIGVARPAGLSTAHNPSLKIRVVA